MKLFMTEKTVGAFTSGKSLLFLFFAMGMIVTAQAQQLEAYILEAEKNNPEIQAFVLKYERASEKVNELNSLPDTELSAGYFVSEPETRTGAQKARFGVRQMLPWFGTITARENYVASMADTEYEEIAIARRKLAMSIARSYYQLYALKARQGVVSENVELLDVYRDLALNSLEVGSASAVDVLKLQMRQNELSQQIQALEKEFEAERVKFNKLLNRDNDFIVRLPDSMGIEKQVQMQENKVAKVHPELVRFDRLFESVNEAEVLNRKEALPKMGFGVDYILVANRTDMDVEENGKDILMPMVSLSIPLFNNKYKSVSRQNEIRQQEIQALRKQRQNDLEGRLYEALNNRETARITANTFLKNIQQAQDAEEIMLKNYETGTIDFNDVIDIQELQLKFQTGYIEAVKKYYMETALVNYLSN